MSFILKSPVQKVSHNLSRGNKRINIKKTFFRNQNSMSRSNFKENFPQIWSKEWKKPSLRFLSNYPSQNHQLCLHKTFIPQSQNQSIIATPKLDFSVTKMLSLHIEPNWFLGIWLSSSTFIFKKHPYKKSMNFQSYKPWKKPQMNNFWRKLPKE